MAKEESQMSHSTVMYSLLKSLPGADPERGGEDQTAKAWGPKGWSWVGGSQPHPHQLGGLGQSLSRRWFWCGLKPQNCVW